MSFHGRVMFWWFLQTISCFAIQPGFEHLSLPATSGVQSKPLVSTSIAMSSTRTWHWWLKGCCSLCVFALAGRQRMLHDQCGLRTAHWNHQVQQQKWTWGFTLTRKNPDKRCGGEPGCWLCRPFWWIESYSYQIIVQEVEKLMSVNVL